MELGLFAVCFQYHGNREAKILAKGTSLGRSKNDSCCRWGVRQMKERIFFWSTPQRYHPSQGTGRAHGSRHRHHLQMGRPPRQNRLACGLQPRVSDHSLKPGIPVLFLVFIPPRTPARNGNETIALGCQNSDSKRLKIQRMKICAYLLPTEHGCIRRMFYWIYMHYTKFDKTIQSVEYQ